MSTSESEFESNSSDDSVKDDIIDDRMIDMYDDNNYDNYCDFDDTHHFTSLGNIILGEVVSDEFEVPLIDIPENYSIRLAMHSEPCCSTNSSLPIPFLNDSIQSYLTAPPLTRQIGSTGKYCVAIDPTIDESGITSLSTPQLYVGNIPSDTKWYNLKNWFIKQGYGVTYVELKKNRKGARYAFIRFDSIPIAVEVLYISERNKAAFIFNGKKLDIKRTNRSSQQASTILSTMITNIGAATSTSVKITNIHYGTLITETAMQNIPTANGIVSNIDRFGIIAHRLLIDKCKSFQLNIDSEKKKLSIIGELDMMVMDDSVVTTQLKFEWNFRDLKARKITPVLINHNEVFLLIEIKRPPIILEIRNQNHPKCDGSNENRLPGYGLIGHANAWIFKLSSLNLRDDYVKLFKVLRHYNLSPRQFSEFNIMQLIRTVEAARKNLESVSLISNDEWIEQNQVNVNNFLNCRWPSYPFETKFEIMKLISKHIITVNDLIVDEHAEHILKICTINTLIALTDKIVEFAPRWFVTTCDNEDEDWNCKDDEEESTEQQENQVITTTEDLSNNNDNSFISQNIRSCTTGKLVDFENIEIASITTDMKKFLSAPTKSHLGTFSRLLISAFEQLLKRFELCRTKTTGIYVTKLELRTTNADPFLMRKIYITPSTVLYEGPYREEKCAVTRRFVQHQNRFLRVTFRDEDYRVLRNYNDNMTKIYERIKKILIKGVNICDRNYDFLAFSSSQLREHSCWMFAAADDGTTVNTIRAWMGEFQNVSPVAKLAARLGQSFSTSIKGIQLESRQIREISDFIRFETTSECRREHCFTDGIGIIRPEFAKRLTQEMKLSEKICPCAFQIRCGGYKGMVCVDVSDKITNPDEYVHFRKSMNKFTAKENISIDVVRTSLNPSVAYLNRQIILLLSSLGIGDQTFMSLQDHMLQQLKALTENWQKACESLKELNEFGGNGYHGFLIEYLKRLHERKDPFVRQLLFVIKAFLVKELRTKAKIRVPNSWSLLGVIDESRTLNYGEVFIQIDNTHQQTENSTREIIRGPVIVTRNPCFHPGDIRKLKAVDVPALYGLKNVIVFPMQEPRPHPKEMSGGDLDGDTFWISRHPDLIFEKNEDPFDYQDQEDEANKIQLGTFVQHTIKDVCNFFGEYIAADNLGLIANSHLAFADQLENGAKNEKCLQLAKMHSVAVDFAKKGVNAPRLTHELRPTKYPHYMEKHDKPTYDSQTILGKLYDKVIYYSSNLNINEEEEIFATSVFPYESFIINGKDEYVQDARIIKSEYDRDIKRIMRQYGIKHEVEVLSGYILKFTSKQYAKETKIFDLRNEITHTYRVIQEKYLRLFWEEFYQLTDESQEETAKWSDISKKLTWKNQLDLYQFHNEIILPDELKKKASAWFHITYDPWIIHINKYQKNKKKKQNKFPNDQQTEQPTRFQGLFSFAWLIYPVLLKIFDENQKNASETTVSNTKRKNKKKKNKRKHVHASSDNTNEQI